jgi:hypothetical protein
MGFKMKMIKLTALVALVGISASLVACGGAKKQDLGEIDVNVPAWFANTPTSADALFGTANQKSPDMQRAIDKAKAQATTDLASKLEVRVKSLTKKFQQEIGEATNASTSELFEQATKLVVDQSLNGIGVKEQAIKFNQVDKIYSVYILMEMPIGKANAALMGKLKEQQALVTQLKASKSFNDLDAEIEKERAANK